MDIGELLAFGVKNGASDMHLSAGLPPMIRVDGDVRRINVPAMDHTTVHDLVYDIMNDKQQKDFEEFLECDFSFEIPGLARQRIQPKSRRRRCIPDDTVRDPDARRLEGARNFQGDLRYPTWCRARYRADGIG